jgi:hypothetical protein
MATIAHRVYDQAGTLVDEGTIDTDDGPPTLDERVAAVEDAVDTLILDSLGGFDV